MLCEAGEIRFYGVVCSQGGIQPDPNKMPALKQVSAPTSRQVQQTFLGLENNMVSLSQI